MVGRHPTRAALILDRFNGADVSSIVAAVPEYRWSSAYPGREASLFRILQTSLELLDDRQKNFLCYCSIAADRMMLTIANSGAFKDGFRFLR
jgi:hypothetical protein